MQRRHLAVSFGALLLLVVSMGMLVAASNRAQRLAQLLLDFVTAVSHELLTPSDRHQLSSRQHRSGDCPESGPGKKNGSVIGNQVRQLAALLEQVLHSRPPITASSGSPCGGSRSLHFDATLTSTEGDPRRPVHRRARCRAGSAACDRRSAGGLSVAAEPHYQRAEVRVRATLAPGSRDSGRSGAVGKRSRSVSRTGGLGSAIANFLVSSNRSIAALP